HDRIDALPVFAQCAAGFKITAARHSGAFSQPERLVFERVDDLCDGYLGSWTPQGITALHAAHAAHQPMPAQQLEHLADSRRVQAQRPGQLGSTAQALGTAGHIGKHQGAVIHDLADAQHDAGSSECLGSWRQIPAWPPRCLLIYTVLRWSYMSQACPYPWQGQEGVDSSSSSSCPACCSIHICA